MSEISLKELMEARFREIDRRLDELFRAVEKLAESAIQADQFKVMKIRVEKLDDEMILLKEQVKGIRALIKWVMLAVAGLGMALIKRELGL